MRGGGVKKAEVVFFCWGNLNRLGPNSANGAKKGPYGATFALPACCEVWRNWS